MDEVKSPGIRTCCAAIGGLPRGLVRPARLDHDFLAGLVDAGLPMRVHAAERSWPPVLTFARSHDLLGDGSVTLVDLAGHTPGSVGILLRTARGPVLLAGDAAWHSLQIEHIRRKASYPGMLIDEDRAATFRTLHRLHAIRRAVRVVPTHDYDAAQAIP